MITIYDIAKESGFSASAVSKALNGYHDISDKSKNEILKTAQRMGYYPNSIARNLITKRSSSIGILLYDGIGEKNKLGLTHNFFSEILNSFKIEIENNGYFITFISDKSDENYFAHCKSKRLDGIFIVCADFEKKEIQELFGLDKPIIAFDNRNERISSISSDNGEISAELIKQIVGFGYERIYYCLGRESYVTKERLNGVRGALSQINFNKITYINTTFCSIDEGYSIIERVAADNVKRSCVCFTDDYSALGGLKAAHDLRLNVPDDIGIVGFDGIKIGQLLYPNLTTVQQDSHALGRQAAEKLLKLIKNPKEPNEHIVVPSKLLIKDTCRKIIGRT
ncbi:MAG: LacI family transcriptional regulator [Clostridiales bacterium]|jgi:DNA-binding LacI/PurR family transcriptional regulator|nr:LacI family transcriptional regulator [Clostridiales bacterium]